MASTKTKTTAKKAAPKKAVVKEATDKPQRLGARAKKLLTMDLGLTRPQQDEVRAKADDISRARVLPNGKADTLTRVWDIYEASGVTMPKNIADEREDFMKTGVLKRSRSGDGNGSKTPKKERGGKNAASPTPSSGTSPQRQRRRVKKPANGGPPETEPKTTEPQSSEVSVEETETL